VDRASARYRPRRIYRGRSFRENERRALAFDTDHSIFEMKHDPVLPMQRTNEITHFRPEDALRWPFFRHHDVHLDFAGTQRCRHLTPNKTRTDHEHAARSCGCVKDGAAIGERTGFAPVASRSRS
jgi:hypothetical protein